MRRPLSTSRPTMLFTVACFLTANRCVSELVGVGERVPGTQVRVFIRDPPESVTHGKKIYSFYNYWLTNVYFRMSCTD